MPSLLVTVFILQLAIHLVNTIGASAVNTLLWNLYNSLPTPTSKAFKEQKKLQAEYLVTRKQLNSTSAQDQAPGEDKGCPRWSQSEIQQHGLGPALGLHKRATNADTVLVCQGAHVLASARPDPVLRDAIVAAVGLVMVSKTGKGQQKKKAAPMKAGGEKPSTPVSTEKAEAKKEL
ncbi:hypothetical protein V490_02796 [Pseudogymnoascus sp. VKM F-3557]|nr:hypothetical protein V490_02796 [Pseudogymnoascus sp. VKM F-3557]